MARVEPRACRPRSRPGSFRDHHQISSPRLAFGQWLGRKLSLDPWVDYEEHRKRLQSDSYKPGVHHSR
jgi:hypothetical protein